MIKSIFHSFICDKKKKLSSLKKMENQIQSHSLFINLYYCTPIDVDVKKKEIKRKL
jgi:hypothetical protein